MIAIEEMRREVPSKEIWFWGAGQSYAEASTANGCKE